MCAERCKHGSRGEYLETCCSNAIRRRVLSLHRKHGQFEFAAPCILFACLIFTPDISRLERNTAVAAGIVKAFADEGIDIEITADGSRPTKQFAPDADPFIQGM